MTQKSGTCTVAVPLLEAFALPYNSEQATPKPTPICTLTYTPSWRVWIWIYISRGHQMLRCVGVIVESCEVSSSQLHSAF